MDLACSESEEAARRAVADRLDACCPTSRVRAAEPMGFDQNLLTDLDVFPYDGSVTELAVACEEVGKRLAPAPIIEVAVTRRLLRAVATVPTNLPASALPTLALCPAVSGLARLVPAGAVATHVVALHDERLVLVAIERRQSPPPNLGSMPIADISLDGANVVELAIGPSARALHARAVDEWRVLTAAALVGLARGAFDLAVERVQKREQFGVPIGTFQVVQHRLADLATELDGAQLLCWEAAWTSEEGAERTGVLAAMALAFAAATASTVATESLHLHGGLGFTLDCDIQLYFRRAKAWPLLLDDPELELARLGALLYGTAS
jgi:hypothetical protein